MQQLNDLMEYANDNKLEALLFVGSGLLTIYGIKDQLNQAEECQINPIKLEGYMNALVLASGLAAGFLRANNYPKASAFFSGATIGNIASRFLFREEREKLLDPTTEPKCSI